MFDKNVFNNNIYDLLCILKIVKIYHDSQGVKSSVTNNSHVWLYEHFV